MTSKSLDSACVCRMWEIKSKNKLFKGERNPITGLDRP
jgi:hypothetical protein